MSSLVDDYVIVHVNIVIACFQQLNAFVKEGKLKIDRNNCLYDPNVRLLHCYAQSDCIST